MEKADPGPSNVREAEDYTTINGLFDEFMDMLREGNKDALETMIKAIKKHMKGTWTDMTSAQVEITIHYHQGPIMCLVERIPRLSTNDNLRPR